MSSPEDLGYALALAYVDLSKAERERERAEKAVTFAKARVALAKKDMESILSAKEGV